MRLLRFILTASCAAVLAVAQTPARTEFDVASVKQNTSGTQESFANSPLGPGDVFVETGGLFSASNFPLITYISFAYRIQGNQAEALVAQLPAWVMSDRFDIQARSSQHPTKNDMRTMMRALLTERFGFTMHTESRPQPVFALTLRKQGKTGPQLRAHPANSSCQPVGQAAPEGAIDGGFPAGCGGLLPLPHGEGRISKFGARDITMQFLANQLAAMGPLGRPVVDQTGLTGNIDFTLEWSPDPRPGSPEAEEPAAGPSFLEAVSDQLGLKLESQKLPQDTLIVDHIEHLKDN